MFVVEGEKFEFIANFALFGGTNEDRNVRRE
jgi:hypothetical protein